MLTILLAAIDAFSGEKFELLYLFVFLMDLHILDNVNWKRIFNGKEG